MRVTLDKRANVKMMDGHNFRRYQSGQSHDYYGGLAKVSPPYRGKWNVVVDLGGYAGTVGASVAVIR